MAKDYDDEFDDRPSRRSSGPPPQNYLVQSILVTLCCCLPLGIVAIINAAKVNSLAAEGKMREAQEASAAAKKWSTYGFVIGLVLNILSVVAQVVLGGMAGANR
jgi:hypothetical protein